MENKFIFIYCTADSIVKSLDLKDDIQSKMTHAEVITFVIISALVYQGNYKTTRLISVHNRLFPRILSHSRLVRRIHQISEDTWVMIFKVCLQFFKAPHSSEYIVDSFPIAASQNYKRIRCKLFQGKQYHGYTASKKSYFFGLKIHMLVNNLGVPIEFVFTPGSEADIRGFRRMSLRLRKGSRIYADSAYVDYAYEDMLSQEGIKLIAKRRKNSKRSHSIYEQFSLNLTRNRIETTFSAISRLMPRSISARTEKGFCLKVMFFIFAYLLNRLFQER